VECVAGYEEGNGFVPATKIREFVWNVFAAHYIEMVKGRAYGDGVTKEECDAVLDSIAERTGIDERATLYSSTEFKKIRLLYFTEDFKEWERRHGA